MKDEFYYCTLPRNIARERGIRLYMTGKPCRKGGVAPRLTSSAACQCGYCLKRQSEASRNCYKKSRGAYLEKRKAYYETNRDFSLEYGRLYNKEKQNSRREYNSEYKRKNRGIIAEKNKIYRKENLNRFRSYQAKRKAAKINRTLDPDCELTQFVMEEAADLCRTHEDMHGIKFHVDHLIPMQGKKVSGLHVGWNLQLLPATLNIKKGNRLMYTEPFEWVRDAHMVQ